MIKYKILVLVFFVSCCFNCQNENSILSENNWYGFSSDSTYHELYISKKGKDYFLQFNSELTGFSKNLRIEIFEKRIKLFDRIDPNKVVDEIIIEKNTLDNLTLILNNEKIKWTKLEENPKLELSFLESKQYQKLFYERMSKYKEKEFDISEEVIPFENLDARSLHRQQ